MLTLYPSGRAGPLGPDRPVPRVYFTSNGQSAS